MEEQLRRFRADLTEAPRVLERRRAARDQLVHDVRASARIRGHRGLIRLTISKAEFAYLVFPDSPLSAPPYAQAPDLVWMRHAYSSGDGTRTTA